MMQLDLSSLNVVPQEQHVDNIVKWSVFVNVRNHEPCKLGCKIIAEGCKLPFNVCICPHSIFFTFQSFLKFLGTSNASLNTG